MRPLARCSSILLAFLGCSITAFAQSLRWDSRFTTPGGTNGAVKACAIFDDGSGPALYLGGNFTQAGSASSPSVAKLGSHGWEALGAGLGGGEVSALKVFDDGSGPKLYAAGTFSALGSGPYSVVARWDGSQWSAVGGGFYDGRTTLEVFDDGSGPALYAGGSPTYMGSSIASLARWTGSSWAAVPGFSSNTIEALLTYDDGSGPALYVGSYFPGGYGVSRWTGSAWSPMYGSPPWVGSLCSFDDGSGRALYAGGNFPAGVERWNGSVWAPAGNPVGSMFSSALASFDDGSGEKLYVGSQNILKRLVNGTWMSVGNGVDNAVSTLCAGDAGWGPRLFAGGYFTYSGSALLDHLGEWDGNSLSMPGPAPGQGVQGSVSSLASRTEAGAPTLYAGGAFGIAGGAVVSGIARFRNGSWSELAWGGVGGDALAFYDEGSGPVLMEAGGGGIARWDGTAWSGVGGGLTGPGSGKGLAVYDSGSGAKLYVGGSFTFAGGVASPNIAAWNGTSWSSVGGGVDGAVTALAVFDEGLGPSLFVAGTFTHAGVISANRIARWNGTAWSSLGSGLDFHAYALTVFDDGSGPALYVGGYFATAGGQSAQGIAKWNGATWSALGSGIAASGYLPGVRSLVAYDDGAGAALYAGGQFDSAGGHAARNLARWNGASWSAVGSGTDGTIHVLGVFDESGGAADLFVGGAFSHAGSLESQGIAQWHGGLGALDSFCFGDGSDGSCPCANFGLPGHGCANSAQSGGARLFASGSTSADTLVLHASALLPSALSIFLQGDALLYDPLHFGDGLRCTGGNLRRLFARNASAGMIAVPGAGDPSIRQRSAALGDPLLPGSVRTYQTFYRDPSAGYCPSPAGDTWNITNGLRVVW